MTDLETTREYQYELTEEDYRRYCMEAVWNWPAERWCVMVGVVVAFVIAAVLAFQMTPLKAVTRK